MSVIAGVAVSTWQVPDVVLQLSPVVATAGVAQSVWGIFDPQGYVWVAGKVRIAETLDLEEIELRATVEPDMDILPSPRAFVVVGGTVNTHPNVDVNDIVTRTEI